MDWEPGPLLTSADRLLPEPWETDPCPPGTGYIRSPYSGHRALHTLAPVPPTLCTAPPAPCGVSHTPASLPPRDPCTHPLCPAPLCFGQRPSYAELPSILSVVKGQG